MREIKFREWETERKSMSYSTREDFDDMVGFRFLHTEGGKRILMQYTGLKDKNGREIYEGDILKGLCPLRNEWVGNVKYLAPYYAILGKRSHLMLENFNDMRVIGNIYENPELLEVKK